ncbi:MAG TPA: DNA translocase FtsK 4TM domain-containing protein [Acidimicrobiia bacterium]|nr:DNA translocase FtsK 4TM domain-containing protein [Acidimicrobiia bacterium]
MTKRTPTRRGGSGRSRVSTRNKSPRGGRNDSPRGWRHKLEALRTGFREHLGRQADDVWGVALIVLAILIVLGFLDLAGPFGSVVEEGTRLLFGLWRFLVPPAMTGIGVGLIVGKPRQGAARTLTGAATAFVGSLAMFHLLTGAVALMPDLDLVKGRGGAIGALIAFPLKRLLGTWGAFVLLAALMGMGILLITRTSVRELASGAAALTRQLKAFARSAGPRPRPHDARPARHLAPEAAPVPAPPLDPEPVKKPARSRPARVKQVPPAVALASGHGYHLPPLDLLAPGGGEDQSRKALEDTAGQLEDTLRQHGVDAQLTKIVPGPTVTRYEIELAPGVKVNRVSSLAHDIAYALATPDVRLLVPIPGKSAIGVEVPNRKRRLITLGDVLRSPEAAAAHHPLTVGLGVDISGRAKMLNLADLPHVLIAGATGAGKSSCINSIVTSLLMRTTPDDVRLIMVDPKRVELGQYNGVPHLLTRVITNPKKAADALKWAVTEMDRRYDLLADARVRDILGYREKIESGQLPADGFDRFPYLVVIVDELNDLMMVAGREVEDAIVRIAQMARAVGIHLVIATQRPSVDVITGVIKANIPSRLAFSVASQTDSRVVIDGAGAEKLVGMGDMLVVTASEPRPARYQGAWVREQEIHGVVEWVKGQRDAEYQDHVVEHLAAEAARTTGTGDDEDEAIMRQAIELVVRSQLGSTSMLQRKLRIGFARAGRVMDILERRGVVGPSEGSKAREVLMTVEELEETYERDQVPV